MPLSIVRDDITRMKADAIVNAANTSLLGGGGVDGAIHAAAGPGLLEECRKLQGCPTGQAKITGAYNLHARYVIHTVGPVWHGGARGEEQLLRSCYRNSLRLAAEHGCRSVAFPMISTGVYGYPKGDAMRIAVDEVSGFLMDHEMMVYLVVFGHESYLTGTKMFRHVQAYIDDQYAEQHIHRPSQSLREQLWQRSEEDALKLEETLMAEAAMRNAAAFESTSAPDGDALFGAAADGKEDLAPEGTDEPDEFLASEDWDDEEYLAHKAPAPAPAPKAAAPAPTAPAPKAPAGKGIYFSDTPNWAEMLKRTDEGFRDALLRMIDERGMTDAQCYKKANVDRRLFYKIKNGVDYHATKPTVCAFVMALELPMEEARGLIAKAGFSLTHSSKFDIIVEYFLKVGFYDVMQINEVLFEYDLPLLGSFAA